METKELTWGLKKQTGIDICINEPIFLKSSIGLYNGSVYHAIDVETDEKDNFVCLSLYFGGNSVYYYDKLTDELGKFISFRKLVGHSGKGDLHWLNKWGIDVPIENYVFDTILASYVHNNLRDSHALKPLSKDILNISYPGYNDIVSNGRKRITLDKQPLEIVSNYNCLDTYCTYHLYQYFNRVFTPNQKRIFETIEMPINRLLYQMETKGVKVDLQYLNSLDREFSQKLKDILDCIDNLTKEDIHHLINTYEEKQFKEKWQVSAYKKFKNNGKFNPSSWQQKKLLMEFLGLKLQKTDKHELSKYKGNKLIDLLLEYSEFNKLYSSFIEPLRELPTLPYVHTTYSQVSESNSDEDMAHGIVTGRLSSKNPNLQQIPIRTKEGEKLRGLFVARDGYTFICADYGQIEKRLQAHFSQDSVLLEILNNPERDLFQETADQLKIDRYTAKTMHYALDFGCRASKLAQVIKKPLEEAEALIKAYWSMFNGVWKWRRYIVSSARINGGITTIIGEWKPVDVERMNNAECYFDKRTKDYVFPIREAEERAAISKVVQGSAAAILKLAMLKCKENYFTPLLTVHDELLFEISDNPEYCVEVSKKIKDIMESAIKLSVPLPVDIGVGKSWQVAKK